MESNNWYCIYTKPHCEDNVARRIGNHSGIEIFNPKIKAKKYVRGKVKVVIEELFPCYIFSRFNPAKHYHMIKNTRGVRRVVDDYSGNPHIVDEDIIGRIQSRMNDGFVQVEQKIFQTGDRVEILEGPFRGLEGVLQKELKARERIMVLLNTLSYQVSVEIERGLIACV